MDFSQRAADAATSQINAVLCPILDEALVAEHKANYAATRGSGMGDVAKNRIGAGYIGVPCERELAFRFHRAPIEPRESSVSPGELQRHAEAGHWTEKKTAEWFRLVGITVETFCTAPEGGEEKQIGWKDAKDPATGQYRLAGEVDGVITEVRNAVLAELITPPCIWESKKATDKKWKKFQKEGVKKADLKYYGQLQINMGYLGITQTLFSMLNLDSMKYQFEVVPFDPAHAQWLLDRATGVMRTSSPMEAPRLCRSEDDFNGKFCDFHDQCWAAQKPLPDRNFAPSIGFNPNDMEEPPF